MSSRKEVFANSEYYHIYNHGVEGRNIVNDEKDADRFVKCLDLFNVIEPVGSLYILSFDPERKRGKKLVNIIAYCLNPNHFHMIIEQMVDNGITKFMHRVSGGYSWYFNNKFKRKGSLLQGKFKAKHINNNDYLLHLSAYVNLNDKVHKLSGKAAKLVRSAWSEYTENIPGICAKKILLDQFDSRSGYRDFALDNLPYMLSKRRDYAELKEILLD